MANGCTLSTSQGDDRLLTRSSNRTVRVMARSEAPIKGRGPRADFARRLRAKRAEAGFTYRELSRVTHFSPSILCCAAGGVTVPTWDVAWAYLRACHVPESERDDWERLWAAARGESQDGRNGST